MTPHTADRPRLVFAHANGFPGLSYKSLLAPLGDTFAVHTLECLGHDPDYPVEHNWNALVEELLDSLPPPSAGPVLGVGHSLGGILMAMAARRQPQRFRGVIMLDSPLMLGPDALVMKVAKRLGLMDRITPAGKTSRRRRYWPSREAMADSLRHRSLFRRFTPEALDDYVQAGSRDREDGRIALAFDPAVEARIFRHLPDNLSRLPGRLEVPTVVIAGEASDLLTATRIRRLERRGLTVLGTPGAHMFPMECPEATRAAIRRAWTLIRDADGRAP
ncbi:alpha/beta hydrolase [Vreelandella jeotgali]|uniref:alpha/beta hydrolase n=1 Tax=Vreelandella jeotgali TaxID=553386 RepID=UPI00034504A0|nr:alpha/beta hydrolase [Halomonas jeotgali]